MRTHTTIAFASFVCSAALTVAGCGNDNPAPAPLGPPLVPADYATALAEVRACRKSPDHDLAYVRIVANDAAQTPYSTRAAPFPVGATIVKVEYADATCSDVTGFTVMHKEAAGYAPATSDWHWQKASRDRTVVEDGQIARCSNCHKDCIPPDGFGWTCAAP